MMVYPGTIPDNHLCAKCKKAFRVSGISYCRPCERERQRAVYSTTGRAWRYKKRYGITIQQYEELFVRQGGKCAICRGSAGKRRLAVDHDHRTGRVRGLLCIPCNRGLGLYQDNPELLDAAARYLEKEAVS